MTPFMSLQSHLLLLDTNRILTKKWQMKKLNIEEETQQEYNKT